MIQGSTNSAVQVKSILNGECEWVGCLSMDVLIIIIKEREEGEWRGIYKREGMFSSTSVCIEFC